MFHFFKKSDVQIQTDVKEELSFTPGLRQSHILVAASDGIVTLRGNVPHFFEKAYAAKTALRVRGVRAVANEIEVNLLGAYHRGDEDIARAALMALEWNYQVPPGVKVTVEKGWVTLAGEVEWNYERNAAKEAVTPLMGVCGITCDIVLKSKVQTSDVKNRIEEALRRSAESEGRKIHVNVDGNRVVLSGHVSSLSEIEDAKYAAWNAPGVTMVENNLRVGH